MSRILGVVAALLLAVAGCAGGSQRAGSTDTATPVATQTTEATDAGETTETTTAPTYSVPKAKDFKVTIKVREKQCFGSAGCNVTYRVELAWNQSYDPAVTYDVTYEVRGGEDGPVVNTLTVTGDEYQRDSEELVSTRSMKTKLSAVVTDVTEQ